MNVKIRKEARRDGDKWYFTGNPCKHGHLSKRYVKNGACQQCHNEVRYNSPIEKAKRRKYWFDNYEKYLFNSARQRAKRDNIEFSITSDDIKIPDYCPCLWIPLVKMIGNNNGKRNDSSPSLDRVDSTRGYVKDNVSVISWRANRLKHNATMHELKGIVRYTEGRL